MKGIILAGGRATRLYPVTQTISKQLMPMYDRQMIFYPLNTLIKAGITEILIVVNPKYAGQFLSLLGPMFDKSGVNLSFRVQTAPRGLPDAFILGEDFIDSDSVAMILGDNIFEGCISEHFKSYEGGCKIFLKHVSHPEKYGVAEFEASKLVRIIEKPQSFISNLAVTGLYIFPPDVVQLAKNLKPSGRGEIEITDLINIYLGMGMVEYTILPLAWFDAGTFDDWLDANIYVREHRLYEDSI